MKPCRSSISLNEALSVQHSLRIHTVVLTSTLLASGFGLKSSDVDAAAPPDSTPETEPAWKAKEAGTKDDLPLAKGEADQCYCPGTLKSQTTAGSICQECGCMIKLAMQPGLDSEFKTAKDLAHEGHQYKSRDEDEEMDEATLLILRILYYPDLNAPMY